MQTLVRVRVAPAGRAAAGTEGPAPRVCAFHIRCVDLDRGYTEDPAVVGDPWCMGRHQGQEAEAHACQATPTKEMPNWANPNLQGSLSPAGQRRARWLRL